MRVSFFPDIGFTGFLTNNNLYYADQQKEWEINIPDSYHIKRTKAKKVNPYFQQGVSCEKISDFSW